MVSDCGRMEVITGSITAEVDVPTSQRVLASLDVIGTVGTAKLHVPKNKPVMCRYIVLWFCLLQLLLTHISLKLACPMSTFWHLLSIIGVEFICLLSRYYLVPYWLSALKHWVCNFINYKSQTRWIAMQVCRSAIRRCAYLLTLFIHSSLIFTVQLHRIQCTVLPRPFCPFVHPSVCQTRGLWQTKRNLCPHSSFIVVFW